MDANHVLDALGEIGDSYIAWAGEPAALSGKVAPGRGRPVRRAVLLAAVVAVLLALCGFLGYELGLYDPWLQKPASDPVGTVRSAIESQAEKDYTIEVQVDALRVDDAETERVRARYAGSELAASRGWTDELLAENFVVVWAKYEVTYDHTKTFLDDGTVEQYFYLLRDVDTGTWTIVDNTGTFN